MAASQASTFDRHPSPSLRALINYADYFVRCRARAGQTQLGLTVAPNRADGTKSGLGSGPRAIRARHHVGALALRSFATE